MVRYIVFLALGLLISLPLSAQKKKDKFKTTASGVEYKIIGKSKGKRIAYGDMISVHVQTSTYFDSIVFSTYAVGGEPVTFEVKKESFNPYMMEGFTMLTNGDSAIMRISNEKVFEGAHKRPPYAVDSQYMQYVVKIVDHVTKEELEAEIQEQRNADQLLIEAHIKEKGYTTIKTASGLHYTVLEEGNRPRPLPNQTVEVHYTGKLLDGTIFDSSYDRNQPIAFPLGQGRVIKGWDEGIALLNVGSKAIFFIPSELAYGTKGAAGGKIPPNAVLIFEVELVDVK